MEGRGLFQNRRAASQLRPLLSRVGCFGGQVSLAGGFHSEAPRPLRATEKACRFGHESGSGHLEDAAQPESLP